MSWEAAVLRGVVSERAGAEASVELLSMHTFLVMIMTVFLGHSHDCLFLFVMGMIVYFWSYHGLASIFFY